MTANPDDPNVPGSTESEPARPEADEANSRLPRPIQEHLGQQLRTTYNTLAEKPAFLGDSVVPPHLDHHLQRLETREKIRDQGVDAIAEALEEMGLDLGPTPAEDEKR